MGKQCMQRIRTGFRVFPVPPPHVINQMAQVPSSLSPILEQCQHLSRPTDPTTRLAASSSRLSVTTITAIPIDSLFITSTLRLILISATAIQVNSVSLAIPIDSLVIASTLRLILISATAIQVNSVSLAIPIDSLVIASTLRLILISATAIQVNSVSVTIPTDTLFTTSALILMSARAIQSRVRRTAFDQPGMFLHKQAVMVRWILSSPIWLENEGQPRPRLAQRSQHAKENFRMARIKVYLD
ncbi:hypothetical protein RRG08_042272 [Elysia crispata]|uniref:Uncharacterized protein n=1 Tax=Elysia crispata TaxID=231223 RepID=A0AAE1AHC6_9GAST|nr:hypothetical protein RRG08_042272 [Elysia crispata]